MITQTYHAMFGHSIHRLHITGRRVSNCSRITQRHKSANPVSGSVLPCFFAVGNEQHATQFLVTQRHSGNTERRKKRHCVLHILFYHVYFSIANLHGKTLKRLAGSPTHHVFSSGDAKTRLAAKTICRVHRRCQTRCRGGERAKRTSRLRLEHLDQQTPRSPHGSALSVRVRQTPNSFLFPVASLSLREVFDFPSSLLRRSHATQLDTVPERRRWAGPPVASAIWSPQSGQV